MKKITSAFLLSLLFSLSLTSHASQQESYAVICGNKVELRNFMDLSNNLRNDTITDVIRHIENFRFEAIDGTFSTCADINNGIGWVGEFNVNGTVKKLAYFVSLKKFND